MDFTRLNRRLEALMICPICYEEYTTAHPPVTLGCGHTFCETCVTRLKQKRVYMKCPVDNKKKRMLVIAVNHAFLGLITKIRHEGFANKNNSEVKGVTANIEFASVTESQKKQKKQLKIEIERTKKLGKEVIGALDLAMRLNTSLQ